MDINALADAIAADPVAAWRALDCADARESLHDFCGMIEIPGAPIDDDAEDAEQFQPIETPQAAHHKLLIDKLEAVERGEIKRLMVFMPPGSAKSTYASVVFPAWFMGRKKRRNVIVATYASSLGKKIGRRMRSIVKQPAYREIFDTGLAPDQSAADEWALDNGNEFMSGGILSGITGNRADGLIVDDPVKGRRDADSETIQKSTREEFDDSLKTRLKPRGWIVLIQCMTGDTRVLRPDGSESALRDIRPGDEIATYRDGALSHSKVVNWINNGPDRVFEIRTSSGIIVKANERHPFLVRDGEELKWTRLKDLRRGQEICRVNGESGKARVARRLAANSLLRRAATVCRTTTRSVGLMVFGRLRSMLNLGARPILNTGTASPLPSMIGFTPSKAAYAQSAASRQDRTSARTGAESFASTIVTLREVFARCFATTATSQPDISRRLKPLTLSQLTCDFTLDLIEEIRPAGSEDVFDIEVAETENFIANGLVSHNTRWNENDLAGGILPETWDGESGPILCRDEQVWEVLCIPAQAEENDPLGRQPGEMLWTDWFDDAHWANYRANRRTWSALYQQRPSPSDGTFFQREWFKRYRIGDEPRHLRKYLTSDHAPTDGAESDPNVCRVWGIDRGNDLWMLDGFNRVQKMDKTADGIIALIKKHEPFAWFPEDDNNFKSAEPFIILRMKQEGVRTRIEAMSPHGLDKASKAQSFQGMAAMGSVYVPLGPEGDAYIDELVKFPTGKHDEEVDVSAIMGRAIAMAHPAIVPPDADATPAEPKGINEMTWDQLMAQQQPKRDRV